MEKRYQVFVSSTFTDLEDERKGVMESLMKMDCIPAGMELFPAADEEQWAFIQKIIDDCDYYLLIVGGRYGSMTAEGISFTEKEFDYAVQKKIHVIALLHGEPESIPAGKSELDALARRRLDAFRKKVKADRLVKSWTTALGLAAEVVLSVSHAIKAYPKPGWIRGGASSSPMLLEQINELRQRNEELQKELSAKTIPSSSIANLAAGSSLYIITGLYTSSGKSYRWEATASWNDIFAAIAPQILSPMPENLANHLLGRALLSYLKKTPTISARLSPVVYDTIKIQFLALGYVTVKSGFWRITTLGTQAMFEVRTVKEADEPMQDESE